MWIRFFPCLDDDCRQIEERQYTTEAEHKQAVMDMYEALDNGGYCTVTRWNEIETVRIKSQLWEFKI